MHGPFVVRIDVDATLDARLEESRAHDQAEEITRQEKILKLISNELTKNTTALFDTAVRVEVRNGVLPLLDAPKSPAVSASRSPRA